MHTSDGLANTWPISAKAAMPGWLVFLFEFEEAIVAVVLIKVLEQELHGALPTV